MVCSGLVIGGVVSSVLVSGVLVSSGLVLGGGCGNGVSYQRKWNSDVRRVPYEYHIVLVVVDVDRLERLRRTSGTPLNLLGGVGQIPRTAETG